MTDKLDYKKFQATMNKCYPSSPLSDEDAAEAYRNLGEFFCLLARVNEREGIVRLDVLGVDNHPTEG